MAPGRIAMALRPPSPQEIEEIARDFGLRLAPKEAETFRQFSAPFVTGLELLDGLPDEQPPLRYPRTPGERPAPEDNPLGAWYLKTRIEGAPSGRLAGRGVVLKDNVMLAGVPMMNGTRLVEGYVPPVDATIATRILDAGGTIVGKAVCESYCISAGSHTSDSGPVRNPHDPTRSAGGSSSGSAALVAAAEVDLAIGGDQGGSIRVPASLCGVCGMKPTHGLVPYTGILALEPTIDHVGPITGSVSDNALLLEVIAGPDGLDGRQVAPRTEAYTEALGREAEGLRIGVLREGFGQPGGEPDVDEKVRAAVARFEKLGAQVGGVSVPLHRLAPALLGPVLQSATLTVLHNDGCAPGHEDLFVPSFLTHHRRWRERADELPATMKLLLIATELMRRRYGWSYYAKAMNQVRRVRAAYDAALQEFDLLALPTAPSKAQPLPAPDAPLAEVVQAAWSNIANTQPFDHSHHPAMSVPCGTSEGLPVGLMLVGRAFEESTIYRAAHAFEQHADWRTL
jgi:amidase